AADADDRRRIGCRQIDDDRARRRSRRRLGPRQHQRCAQNRRLAAPSPRADHGFQRSSLAFSSTGAGGSRRMTASTVLRRPARSSACTETGLLPTLAGTGATKRPSSPTGTALPFTCTRVEGRVLPRTASEGAREGSGQNTDSSSSAGTGRGSLGGEEGGGP